MCPSTRKQQPPTNLLHTENTLLEDIEHVRNHKALSMNLMQVAKPIVHCGTRYLSSNLDGLPVRAFVKPESNKRPGLRFRDSVFKANAHPIIASYLRHRWRLIAFWLGLTGPGCRIFRTRRNLDTPNVHCTYSSRSLSSPRIITASHANRCGLTGIWQGFIVEGSSRSFLRMCETG